MFRQTANKKEISIQTTPGNLFDNEEYPQWNSSIKVDVQWVQLSSASLISLCVSLCLFVCLSVI